MFDIPFDRLRDESRRKIEIHEIWLRRLIADEMTKEYGSAYFQHHSHGHPLFRKEIREYAAERIAKEPGRYPREIDAILFDHLIDTLCKEELYKNHFKRPLATAVVSREMLREYLERILAARNPLSHSNQISHHQVLQVLCYSEDIMASLRQFKGCFPF
jgi:hypothetical protein